MVHSRQLRVRTSNLVVLILDISICLISVEVSHPCGTRTKYACALLKDYTTIYTLLGHLTLLHRLYYTTIIHCKYCTWTQQIQLYENSFYFCHPKPPPTNSLPVQILLQIFLFLILTVHLTLRPIRMRTKIWVRLR